MHMCLLSSVDGSGVWGQGGRCRFQLPPNPKVPPNPNQPARSIGEGQANDVTNLFYRKTFLIEGIIVSYFIFPP